MQTPDTTTAPDPSGDAGTEECSTRGLIEELEAKVIAAKLAKEMADRQATALADHLEQLKGYETKIETVHDEYEKGIGAVDADYDSLRTAVDQSKTLFECLVPEAKRKTIADILETLRERRETLKACVWKLSAQILDKQCKLDHRNAKLARENGELEVELARLELCKAELADLKDLKGSIDCSDGISNSCRYGYYLDIVERLKVKCPSAADYMCELVDQVERLDKARQDVTASENELSVARDLLARVTKLRDDLVGGWREEVCRAITAGSVPPLPDDIDKACAKKAGAAAEPSTPPSGEAKSTPELKPTRVEAECERRPTTEMPQQSQGT